MLPASMRGQVRGSAAKVEANHAMAAKTERAQKVAAKQAAKPTGDEAWLRVLPGYSTAAPPSVEDDSQHEATVGVNDGTDGHKDDIAEGADDADTTKPVMETQDMPSETQDKRDTRPSDGDKQDMKTEGGTLDDHLKTDISDGAEEDMEEEVAARLLCPDIVAAYIIASTTYFGAVEIEYYECVFHQFSRKSPHCLPWPTAPSSFSIIFKSIFLVLDFKAKCKCPLDH